MNVPRRRWPLLVVIILAVTRGVAVAQEAQKPAPAPAHEHDAQAPAQRKSLPNLSDRRDWPEPVADSATFSYLIFDVAEFQRTGSGPNALRWDGYGWRGGDVHRFWFKSEGRIESNPGEDSELEGQALYGKLIWPYFDLQTGIRGLQAFRTGSDPTRVYAVIGLQGLSPYRFELEPALFVSHKGQVSGRLTAAIDLLLSQRLVLQPRLETNFAVQDDEAIGIGAGWNDAEVGVRLRYEVRREFAPYFGITWKESFGATHRLAAEGGGDPSHFVVVIGTRTWF